MKLHISVFVIDLGNVTSYNYLMTDSLIRRGRSEFVTERKSTIGVKRLSCVLGLRASSILVKNRLKKYGTSDLYLYAMR